MALINEYPDIRLNESLLDSPPIETKKDKSQILSLEKTQEPWFYLKLEDLNEKLVTPEKKFSYTKTPQKKHSPPQRATKPYQAAPIRPKSVRLLSSSQLLIKNYLVVQSVSPKEANSDSRKYSKEGTNKNMTVSAKKPGTSGYQNSLQKSKQPAASGSEEFENSNVQSFEEVMAKFESLGTGKKPMPDWNNIKYPFF